LAVPESSDDNLDRPLWGCKAIAEEINAPVRRTFHLLESGRLPAVKFGERWVSTPRKLRTALGILDD
jgi:hypothetical protein